VANILIVSSNLRDWTKSSGGSERTAILAESLSEHSVTFLSFAWSDESYSHPVNEYITEVRVPVEPQVLRKYRTYAQGIAKNNWDISFQLLAPFLKNFRRKLRDLSRENDIVILDHYAAAPLLEGIGGIPIIYNSHNAELSMASQLYPDDTRAIGIVKAMEDLALNNSSAITYCSKEDFNYVQQNYRFALKKSAYIPNGTDIHEKIKPLARMKSKDILFVGSGHYPNQAAAKNLIPIAKALPEYNFVTVGDSSNVLRNLAGVPKNIKILGHVSSDELDSLFKNSFAFINPMESGSGTHLKMMRAFGYGIPIISSQIGARGLSDAEMKSILIGKNTADYVSLIKLLESKEQYTAYCNASANLGNTFNWEKIKKDYANFINNIIEEKVTTNKKIPVKEAKPKPIIYKNRKKVLVYSIIRNRAEYVDLFYKQLKNAVLDNPEYEFYLSVYENDSNDGTKQKLFTKDWSFFSGVSIITEKLDTQYFGSVKDAKRVENLAKARNKAIEAGGFLNQVDYVLMVEGDIRYDSYAVKKLLTFSEIEPDFDIVSSVSIRKNGSHYDCWATRTGAVYKDGICNLHGEIDFRNKSHGKYYSTSNGICLYRAKPFQEGIRHHWINAVTKAFDCEMVVLCQNFIKNKYDKIFINYQSMAYHV
jgi:glycosyltransferase involved in cell wall biosynthesis